MIRVQQTIVDANNGDSLRACVASLLHFPIDKVPNFAKFMERSTQSFMDYMELFGLKNPAPVFRDNAGVEFMKDADNKHLSYGSLSGLTIAIVMSNRFKGRFHSVIINENFQVVFDPTTELEYSIEGKNLIDSNDLYLYWIFKG